MAQSDKGKTKKEDVYQGFEQGPIRPPSEARSLLIRATRNCPWNHCTFCPVYKGTRFSLRRVDHVIEDIEAVYRYLEKIMSLAGQKEGVSRESLARTMDSVRPQDPAAFQAAMAWYNYGMDSIFIQDANSLIIKPKDMIAILEHLRRRFPWVKRITSYARSHTLSRIKPDDLSVICTAGLNRIHVGMESGSDKVLANIRKGATKASHIKAGILVRQAGMELSEYVMPGLGGRSLSQEHAFATADALNQINPDFIRLRSLAIPPNAPLFTQYSKGEFDLCSGVEVAEEILLFLSSLDGITSTIKSDHILNLFETVEGRLPDDKEAMMSVVSSFLDLDPKAQTLFQVGRRLGLFRSLNDINNQANADQAMSVIDRMGITPENVDKIIYEMMAQFI